MTNKKVIIIGGGVAGMSAAHELTERGYDVEIYERNEIYVGGKARSVDYKGSIAPFYKTPLPGEHGFRFFPGFYKHITDTMKRIPYTSAEGKALEGVTVRIKGSSSGVATNEQGVYRIQGVNSKASLIFSSVGYTEQEVAIDGRVVVTRCHPKIPSF